MKSILINVLIALALFIVFSPLVSQITKFICYLAVVVGCFPFIKLNKKVFFVFAPLLIYLIVSLVIDWVPNSFANNIAPSFVGIYFIISMIFGLFCVQPASRTDFFHRYEKVIFVFCIISFVSVVVYTFIPEIAQVLPSYENRFTSHKTLFATNILTVNGQVVTRNPGFTTEPGMFQLLLNIGLLIYCLSRVKGDSLSKFKIVAYILAIISTESTVGLFTMTVSLLFLLFRMQNKYRLFGLVLFVLSIPLQVSTFNMHLDNKLNLDKESFQVRAIPALNVIEEHSTLFGRGNSFYDEFNRVEEIGSYDSFTQIIVRYGYVGLFIFLGTMLVVFIINPHKILMLPIVLTMFSQAIWFSPFVVLILGLVMLNKERFR